MLSIRPNITFMLMKLQRHVIFICIDVKIRNFPKRFRSFMYLCEIDCSDLIHKAGSAVHPSRFGQALGDGVEEALGHIVSHAGAGVVDEDQSRHGVGSRRPHAAENLIQHDHSDEAREHAQNQAGVHQQLSALEAKPGENIADAQHHKGLQHRRSQGGDQRIAEPNGEARFGPQIDVVVKAPLLGDDVAHTSGGFSPEGLQQDARKGRYWGAGHTM